MAFKPISVVRLLRRTVSAVAIAIVLDAFRKLRWPAAMLVLLLSHPAAAQTNPQFAQRVIIISVDGLRSDVIESFDASQLPAFHRLMDEGAWTLNARSDPQFTITMPNHVSMMTGRWVHDAAGSGPSHGWAYNDDADPNLTVHANNTSYVPSIWDVVHDEGGRTGLFATKEKFAAFDRSWNEEYGRADLTSPDYGTDKIDRYVYKNLSTDLIDDFLTEATSTPLDLAFIHLADPDREGHATGWNPAMGSAYTQSIIHVDTQLGRILDFVETHPSWAGRTQLILTSDHGGTALNHADPLIYEHFRIPFLVWGSKAEADADLYVVNGDRRIDPGMDHIAQTAPEHPIHNAEAANLALRLMGLPAIPESSIGRTKPLLVRSPEPENPTTFSIAFQDGVAPSTDYTGTRDTKLRSDAPSTAFGSSDFLEVDAGPDYAALVGWDVSSLPDGAIIRDASIVLHVTNVSTTTYHLYALNVPWEEASATWNDRSSGTPWSTPGGQADRAATVLAEVEGSTLGELRIPLGTAAVEVVQGWVENPTSNHGFMIENFDTGDDGLDVSSREAAEPALRPRMELSYVLATTIERPAAPEALFELRNQRGATRNQVTVDGTAASQPGTAIVSWQWDFGDQTTAIGPEAIHTYVDPGTYEVSLTVVDSVGASDTSTRIVIVDEYDDNPAGSQASFQQAVHPLPSYQGAADVKLQADAATTNFGNDVSLFVDGSPFYSTLMRWDMTAIAPGIEVSRASLTFEVVDPTDDVYQIYPLTVPWSETEATWEESFAGQEWTLAGAEFEGDVVGESMGTFTGGTNGSNIIEFNDTGLAWLGRWINEPETNHGFVIQNFLNAENGIDFLSSEAPDSLLRPRLDLTYRMAHHVNLPERVEFGAWPNPFRNELNVAVRSDLSHPVDLELYDMLGRRVVSQTLDPASFGDVRLDTSFLAAGVYALILTEHGTRVSTTRLVARQ